MTFAAPAESYDDFMGRYSRALAPPFARFASISPGLRVLDVGAGPGALTEVFAEVVGAASVAAAEPSAQFAEACAERVPGADVRQTSGEALPWGADSFDVAAAQLVLNFMKDADQGVEEMQRVVKPGGTVATCIWDTGGGMEMLRAFWEAAIALNPSAPAEGARARFGVPGELRALFATAALEDVVVEPIDVEGAYEDFDDFWRPFTGGVGPAGSYCVSLTDEAQGALREECRMRLNKKSGPFRLGARSWAIRGRKPA
ncbi:MAG: hypothetical protein QOD60_561 [Solirubrobacterales bacterium]|nr:hypothetical protein [Solirubrobacterales bacterium]